MEAVFQGYQNVTWDKVELEVLSSTLWTTQQKYLNIHGTTPEKEARTKTNGQRRFKVLWDYMWGCW